ncbi:MAG: dethiobiotin synthase [Phycisphaerae bacterium]
MAKRFNFDVSHYPQLPQLRGLMIMGTDAEVGKTLAAGAIARSLVSDGRKLEVFKPVATGCKRHGTRQLSHEAAFLAACSDSRRQLRQIVPTMYKHELLPNVAAEWTKREIDLDAILGEYATLTGQADAVIVEAPEGVMCPITDDFWSIHFALLAKLPVVLVARAGLGTVNQTLLSLHALRSVGLRVAGVVINRYHVDPAAEREITDPNLPYTHGDEDLAMYTNPTQIAERGRVEVLATIPEEADNSVQDVVIGRNTQFAVDQPDWWRLMED